MPDDNKGTEGKWLIAKRLSGLFAHFLANSVPLWKGWKDFMWLT